MNNKKLTLQRRRKNKAIKTIKTAEMVETLIVFKVNSNKSNKSIDENVINTLFIIKSNGIKNPNKNGIAQSIITKNLFTPLMEVTD